MIRRREFITLLGGAATAWPLAAWAQPGERVRRIGVLMSGAETDPELQSRIAAFRQTLEQHGWSQGRNIRIDIRFAGIRAAQYQALAKEIVALKPDAILGHTTPVVAALQRESSAVPIVFVNVSDPIGSREPGTSSRQYHRPHAVRGGYHWQVAGLAQGDRAKSQARRPHGQSDIDAL
jgi:putative ABC transport system substrate-binding protein